MQLCLTRLLVLHLLYNIKQILVYLSELGLRSVFKKSFATKELTVRIYRYSYSQFFTALHPTENTNNRKTLYIIEDLMNFK